MLIRIKGRSCTGRTQSTMKLVRKGDSVVVLSADGDAIAHNQIEGVSFLFYPFPSIEESIEVLKSFMKKDCESDVLVIDIFDTLFGKAFDKSFEKREIEDFISANPSKTIIVVEQDRMPLSYVGSGE